MNERNTRVLLLLLVHTIAFFPVVFFCSFIPVAGVLISTLPIGFVALTEYGLGRLAAVVLMVVVAHAVEAYALNPAIYSAHLKLHPLLVLAVLVVVRVPRFAAVPSPNRVCSHHLRAHRHAARRSTRSACGGCSWRCPSPVRISAPAFRLASLTALLLAPLAVFVVEYCIARRSELLSAQR